MITEIIIPDDETKTSISLIIRGENWGVQLDNHITPLYCCNCTKQLAKFYKLDGSRYGQVGSVNCECGAEIHCVDSDNIVEYLDTITTFQNRTIGKHKIDFKTTYRLSNTDWQFVKDKIGYDIFIHKNQTLELDVVMDEIIQENKLIIDSTKQFTADKFNRLPLLINRWLCLLESIDK